MHLLTRAIRNIDLGIACAALLVVVGSVTWGVVTRYVFPQPATWATELSAMAFAWVVFFGSAAALRRGMHIGIPVVVDLLPPAVRKAVAVFATALVTIFLAYTFYLACVLALQSASRPSPVLRISFLYVYAGVALAIFIMLINAAIQCVRTVRSSDGQIGYHGQGGKGEI